MKILLVGYGKINKMIHEMLEDEVVGIWDLNHHFLNSKPDVIIDFSHPDFLDYSLNKSMEYGCSLIVGTTGYKSEDLAKISQYSKILPILKSDNFSIGINLLLKIFKDHNNVLNLYEKEIIETHHSKKLDSPSGTAIALAKALETENISSIRIGDVIGIHDIILDNDSEIISIKHIVNNRKVFAEGAIIAARWLENRSPGLYSFGDLYEL